MDVHLNNEADEEGAVGGRGGHGVELQLGLLEEALHAGLTRLEDLQTRLGELVGVRAVA